MTSDAFEVGLRLKSALKDTLLTKLGERDFEDRYFHSAFQ